jgi:hypothetical protein
MVAVPLKWLQHFTCPPCFPLECEKTRPVDQQHCALLSDLGIRDQECAVQLGWRWGVQARIELETGGPLDHARKREIGLCKFQGDGF